MAEDTISAEAAAVKRSASLLLARLNGQAGIELLTPAADDRLRMWPVSRRVNKTGNSDDDPTLIDEVAA